MIDLKSGKLVKNIPVQREPISAVLNSAENYLLVVNHLPFGPSTADYVAAEISVIDTENLSVIKSTKPGYNIWGNFMGVPLFSLFLSDTNVIL